MHCGPMQVEAGAAKDELKRLRKEMLRLKNEWTTLKALYESAKVCQTVLASPVWHFVVLRMC